MSELTYPLSSEFDELYQNLHTCMACDQHGLRTRLTRLQKAWRAGRENEAQLSILLRDINASATRHAERLKNVPSFSFPQELPVSAHHAEIAMAIREHQVLIVAGETGSGKTTQLPKICLSAGRGVSGLIGHTQPRRIAARSVAARIAEELGTTLGDAVGYKVRFSDRTHQDGYIKLMTDGILLAELQQDYYLNQYDTLIIDEAHERSLNIDFLLGYLKRMLPRRRDLKLIITSATIDTERFSRHFAHAPVIEVSGRTYPVEVRYRPLGGEDGEEDADVTTGILSAVDELAEIDGRGDILVFLNGERDIREVAEALRKHHPANTEVLPLYSRLSTTEQNRIFQASRGRRIVLATNVAETSLTVPGIRFVVDPGTARISRYSYRSKVQRLPIEKISQSSANQRAGRCGRVSNGVCIRLYSEQDFAARPAFTEPEIQRTNLASVILQMRQLGLGNPGEFPFIDPPDSHYINDGYRLLQELGALDDHHQLTPLGRDLARLPIDPRIGRMILAANQAACLKEVLIIASALSVQEPRERPMDRQQQADEKHAPFRDEESDFISFLKLWQHYQDKQQHLSKNQLRKYCRQNFLSYMRMREWQATHQQLRALVKGMGLQVNQTEAEYAQIHQSLLTGLLGNIGFRTETKKQAKTAKRTGKASPAYLGARNTEFHLFPGSSLIKRIPRWVMAAELVETSRLFARYIARIEPEWIEAAATHLIKRNYSEPHWDERRGIVSAFETVTLYGLILHARRPVHYGPLDAELAREIFIREALVQGRLRTRAAFMRHNRQLIEEARRIEEKTRRRDVVVDDERLFDIFNQLLPENINTSKSFERWRKKAEIANPDLLKLNRHDVIAGSALAGDQDYPGTMSVNDVVLPLGYCFNPGGEDDGITVSIPLGAINQLDDTAFEWLVPGFLLEKITALLKSLPKSLRRQLVPIPDHARIIFQQILTETGNRKSGLLDVLKKQLTENYHLEIKDSDWRLEELPSHLLMRFRIVDHLQKQLGVSRNLQELRQRFASQVEREIIEVNVDHHWPDHGIRNWDFGELPVSIEIARGDSRYRAYPAIVDKRDSVGIVLHDSAEAAETEHGKGLIRLVMLTLGREIKYLHRNLPHIEAMCLRYTALGSCESLKNDLMFAVIEQCFFIKGFEIRSPEKFAACIEHNQSRLMTVANDICELVEKILNAFYQISTGDWRRHGTIPGPSQMDIQDQLNGLVFSGFLTQISHEYLYHLPRYLTAIEQRLEKLTHAPAADVEKMDRLLPYLKIYDDLYKKSDGYTKELTVLRWMLEEYRVSLFAQTLGTSMPISAKRLDAQIKVCENKI